MPNEKALPGNLPPDPRGFVGRRDELAWLAEELDPEGGGSRLVTLVGVGGVGKTRLALRAARAVRESYPDGVWLVELSPVRAQGQVPLAVMEAMRLADQSSKSVSEALGAWAADKRLLLVLDTCEHLLAGCGALVADLLAAAPGLHVLVTSREPLDLPGERTQEVEALHVSDAGALFVQRAAALGPSLVLDATAERQVIDICRGLDGIPLAVELAAARLESYSLEQLHELLAERLGSRFDVLALAEEKGQGPPRHRTLRTTIGWSHELCAPPERLLWARLSVFAGTFTVGAATWVCSGGPLRPDRVADLLLRLVRQSIVLRHPADPDRFRLLDTVREFGADWLCELGEEEAVRLRHREHYRRFAREACSDWTSSRQVAWCERVFAEQANLRAAMDCALAEPGSPATLEMAGSIGFLWRHCGFERDAKRCLDRTLAVEHAPGEELVRALWARAAVALNQADPVTAGFWAERCMDAAHALGDAAVIEATGYVVAGGLAASGRLAEAAELVSALPTAPVGSDWRGSGQLQVRSAKALFSLLSGDYDEARETAVAIREECDRCGERWTDAFLHTFIAQADLAQGRIEAARDNARTAVAGHRRMHNIPGIAYGLDALAAAEAQAEDGDGRHAARLHGVCKYLWGLVGGEQFHLTDLIAAREARERLLRDRLGDKVYEQAHAEGLAMPYDESLDYALS